MNKCSKCFSMEYGNINKCTQLKFEKKNIKICQRETEKIFKMKDIKMLRNVMLL